MFRWIKTEAWYAWRRLRAWMFVCLLMVAGCGCLTPSQYQQIWDVLIPKPAGESNPAPTPVPEPSTEIPPVIVEPTPIVEPSPILLHEGECIDVSAKDNQIHFSVKGLRQFAEVKDRFLLFAEYDANGKEGNFQIDITGMNTHVISQRFDMACGGRAFCEGQDVNPVEWDLSKWYSFDVAWNQEFKRRNGEVVSLNKEVWMETWDGATPVMQWRVPLWAGIGLMKSVRIGSGCINTYGGLGNLEMRLQ